MKKFLGVLLIPIILVLAVGEFIAIVDPEGTKMAASFLRKEYSSADHASGANMWAVFLAGAARN